MVNTKYTFFVIVITFFLRGSFSFIAYDCESPSDLELKRFSSVTTPVCEFKEPKIRASKIEIQILQIKSLEEIDINRCYIKHSHLLQRCGRLTNQIQDAAIYSDYDEITSSECEDMIDSKTIKLRTSSGPFLVNLKLDELNEVPYTSIGKVEDGDCSGEVDLTANGIKYKRVIRFTKTTIIISKITGRLNHESGKLVFPNGNQKSFSEGSHFTADYGYLYWNPIIQKPGNCAADKENFVVIFEGLSDKVVEELHDNTKSKSYIFDINEYKNQLHLSGKLTTICGMKAFNTEHPQLFIIEKPEGYNFILGAKNGKIDPIDINIMTYFNAKLVHVMRNTKQQVDQLFRIFSYEKCKTENRITHNLLTLSQISPLEFAFDFMQSPGYTAVSLGEVIYISKCLPIEVMYEPSSKCYKELTVIVNQTRMFMQPRTKVLSKIGTEISCSTGVQPMFNIMNEWYIPGLHGLIKSVEPDIVIPSYTNFSFEIIKNLASGGIYSSDSIEKMQDLLMLPMKENTIKSVMSSALEGNARLPEGFSFLNTLDKTNYKKITEEVSGNWESVTKKTVIAAEVIFVLAIVMICIRFSKCIIDTIVNAVTLVKEIGATWLLLFSCWGNIVHLILRKTDKKKSERREKEKEEEEKEKGKEKEEEKEEEKRREKYNRKGKDLSNYTGELNDLLISQKGRKSFQKILPDGKMRDSVCLNLHDESIFESSDFSLGNKNQLIPVDDKIDRSKFNETNIDQEKLRRNKNYIE